MLSKSVNISVFKAEFDGIDKSGKDTLVNEMIKIFPNYCSLHARGLISQIAYSKLYNRNWNYPFTEGYIQNTLFIYLDVDEEDWYLRLRNTNEIENNEKRSDVDFVSDYAKHRKAFDDTWNDLISSELGKKYSSHFLYFNTSKMTAVAIAEAVKRQLIKLNNIE